MATLTELTLLKSLKDAEAEIARLREIVRAVAAMTDVDVIDYDGQCVFCLVKKEPEADVAHRESCTWLRARKAGT